MARKTGRGIPGQQETEATRAGENGMADGNGRDDGMRQPNDFIDTEEIAARAYDIYEREGRMDGRDMEHWFRAEAELRQERNRNRQNMPRSARLQQEQRESERQNAVANS
jgi:hypothetical protein